MIQRPKRGKAQHLLPLARIADGNFRRFDPAAVWVGSPFRRLVHGRASGGAQHADGPLKRSATVTAPKRLATGVTTAVFLSSIALATWMSSSACGPTPARC
jgi:hypothetical protein